MQILHVFKYTVKFLQKHNLRYVACGGTVLGAVRHQNFIPWDDDIDIYLPRADYERLLDLKEECRKDGFDVLSLRDKGYYLPFAKVSDMNTTLWEEKKFPKYYHPSLFIGKIRTFGKHLGLWVCEEYDLSIVEEDAIPGAVPSVKYQNWYSSFDGDKTVCVTQWAGRIFKREWFEDTIELPFGDTSVVVPRDYDGYLTCLYGDYMTLPPVEKRVSEHNHYYLNFDEGLSIEEIKERKK